MALALLVAALVGAQALVVNRAGLSFAGVTAFYGIGGYGLALANTRGFAPALCLLGFALVLPLAFSALSMKLERDLFLLGTLVVLKGLETATSASRYLGSHDGLAVSVLRDTPSGGRTILFLVSAVILLLMLA